MNYVIWSFEHGQWWAPNEFGYVSDLDKAGRYSAEVAGRIVTSSVLLEDIAIAEPVALKQGAPAYHPYDGYCGWVHPDD